MRRSFLSVALLAALIFSASNARGFVPGANSLLHELVELRAAAKLRDLSLQMQATIAGLDTPIEERLYLKAPERVRLLSSGVKGKMLYIEREGKRAAGPEGALQKLTSVTDLVGVWFMPTGKDNEERVRRLFIALKAAGIDTSVVALGLQDDTPAYIIGARAYEPDRPQLWLAKGSLRPLRTVLFDKSKKPPARVETRFTNYGSQAAGDLFAGVIEVYRDGVLTRRSEVQKVSPNQSLPETMFDLTRAR